MVLMCELNPVHELEQETDKQRMGQLMFIQICQARELFCQIHHLVHSRISHAVHLKEKINKLRDWKLGIEPGKVVSSVYMGLLGGMNEQAARYSSHGIPGI
jgi:hypothetical protein